MGRRALYEQSLPDGVSASLQGVLNGVVTAEVLESNIGLAGVAGIFLGNRGFRAQHATWLFRQCSEGEHCRLDWGGGSAEGRNVYQC